MTTMFPFKMSSLISFVRQLGMALLIGALLSMPRPAVALDLSTILESSQVSPPARVVFEEERHNPMFERPLILKGDLEYLGPGALRKIVRSPFQETFSVEDGDVVIERDGKTRRLPVERSRALETVLAAFESMLAGDGERLNTLFAYDITGTVANWTIELRPRSRRVSEQVSKLSLSGDCGGVNRVLMDLHDGEWHVMTIVR